MKYEEECTRRKWTGTGPRSCSGSVPNIVMIMQARPQLRLSQHKKLMAERNSEVLCAVRHRGVLKHIHNKQCEAGPHRDGVEVDVGDGAVGDDVDVAGRQELQVGLLVVKLQPVVVDLHPCGVSPLPSLSCRSNAKSNLLIREEAHPSTAASLERRFANMYLQCVLDDRQVDMED